jgi:hemoglobin
MYNFWENALFYSGTYKGNPLELHKHLHRVMPLEPRHFDQWIRIFNETIDELFDGSKADLAKERAYSIAQIMQRNILKG